MAGPARHADERVRRLAVRRACLAAAPEIHFATHFLPAAPRLAVDSLVVVLNQLGQVMIPAHTAKAPPHADGCAECSGGGESIPQRRAVCGAIIEHLLAGRPTGKPELDGFAQVAGAAGLDRADLERFCDGLATQGTLTRYASWTRLRQMCDQTAGAAALMTFAILRGSSREQTPGGLDGAAHQQTIAWGAALRMARLLETLGIEARGGRLMLPLDDLVRFGVKETEIKAWAAEGSMPDQGASGARWRQLMQFEIERVRRLYEGGIGSLTQLPDERRQAVAIYGQLQMDRLRQLERAGYNAFAQPQPARLWRRLKIIPAAIRQARTRRLSISGAHSVDLQKEERRAKARR